MRWIKLATPRSCSQCDRPRCACVRSEVLACLSAGEDRHTLSQNSAPLKNFCDMFALDVGQFRMPQRAGIIKNLLANRRRSSPEPASIPAAPDGIPDITCNIVTGPSPASLEISNARSSNATRNQRQMLRQERWPPRASVEASAVPRTSTKPTPQQPTPWKSCSSVSLAARSTRRSSRKSDASSRTPNPARDIVTRDRG